MKQSSNKTGEVASNIEGHRHPSSGYMRTVAVLPLGDPPDEGVAPPRRPIPIRRPPPSYPPPPSSLARSAPALPARHEDLPGANGAAVSFRPARISAGEIPTDLTCRFRCDGVVVGPLRVIDLSTVGFAASTAAFTGVEFDPGCALESFELLLRGRAIWTGEAVVVHGSDERVGGRFTSGVVDLDSLRLGATLEGRLLARLDERRHLPPVWRAAVADLRRLLEDARDEIEKVERAEIHDPLRRREEEERLFQALRDRWGAAYYDALCELHAMSKDLDEHAAALGRSYASTMLMPILMACPLQRRAYEKPLGYAGDYRMMELCYTRESAGQGLFGRFLFSVAQNYTLARAVVGREVVVRTAVRQAVHAPGSAPVRILAIAAGPAMELRRWLEETDALARPVQLILVDQDRSAHESAHLQLTRALLERHHGSLPVALRCLQFSVRQLVSPRTPEEQAVVQGTIAGIHLAYSAGLYDYLPDPVAQRLTQRLYSLLVPGGRLLVGNLAETPDTSWLMDYVLHWPILYRSQRDMQRLGQALKMPPPARVSIGSDETGRCLFLDVRK